VNVPCQSYDTGEYPLPPFLSVSIFAIAIAVIGSSPVDSTLVALLVWVPVCAQAGALYSGAGTSVGKIMDS
jgi:hypothetical protein